MSKTEILHEYADCCLEAALESCKKGHQNKSLKLFEKFLTLLNEYRLCAPALLQPVGDQAQHPTFDKLPNDAIPLGLYALACCWRQRSRAKQADAAVQAVVDLVAHDKKLAFLRQNVFQEAARYYADGEQFDIADNLLSKQLAIVKAKGSQVLLEFVTINWLTNRVDLHTSRNEFASAETIYKEALALLESEWEPRQEQVELLHSAWNRLQARRMKSE